MQCFTAEQDWWWLLRHGMAMYQLGLHQEAVKLHQKALQLSCMDEIVLHLTKCHLRLDQPLVAVDLLHGLAADQPGK
jgi:hypothetical protein